jgi:two-component system chemotaxis response regulator CheB
MQINPIKVLIVDPSRQLQGKLQTAMKSDESVQLLVFSGGLSQLCQTIQRASPGALLLNTMGGGSNPAEFLRQARACTDIPVIILSEASGPTEYAKPFKNVDFIKIPGSWKENEISSFCNEICVKIKIAATVKPESKREPEKKAGPPGLRRNYSIVAIGASTGGTEATAEIIKRFPADVPGVLIVQHMPAGFTQMYAERLDRISKLKVSEAHSGDRVIRGTALVAAGGKHMILKKDANGYYVKCMEGEKVNGHCPSVGVLFDSVAAAAGKDAIGVILTGMGKDGAGELLHMRREGAYTIGQDRESSVVYGMPGAAKEIGAVICQAPCIEIAGVILNQLKK